MSDDFAISREDLLSGRLRLDRRPARILASIEARCRYMQVESRRAIEAYFLADHSSFIRRFDLDYFQGLKLRIANPRPLAISALEHYASYWKALVPDNPSVRATLIHLLVQKYPFDYRQVPRIYATCGIGETEVQEAYKSAYGERLVKAFGTVSRAAIEEDDVSDSSPEERALQDTVDSLEWLNLPGGEVLYRHGEESSSLYILISGRLRVETRRYDGAVISDEISRGEMVGEAEVLTGESRGATVIAIRDSELVKLQQSELNRLTVSYPQVMMRINRLLAGRLRSRYSRQRPTVQSVTTVALIPTGPDVPLTDFARLFTGVLNTYAPTLRLNRTSVDREFGEVAAQTPADNSDSARLADWLSAQEAKYRFIIYEADTEPTAWTVRCMRQADRLLLIARAGTSPAPGSIERHIGELSAWGRTELLLVHEPDIARPVGTKLWLRSRPVRRHHHLRQGKTDDLHRLGRWLTNRAQGLVLSGGGARGFAHIGVWKALVEAGIQIDAVGGTSMGSIVAAALAMGDDPDSLVETCRKLFGKYRPFKEYTLPFFSIFRSKRLDQMLHSQMGGIEIEDLWINYYCVSANLTQAEPKIHTEGSLFKAVRSSIAIPGIVPPVIDGNNLFVDGGVVNSLPGDVMKEICQGSVIAVDTTPSRDVEIDPGFSEFPSPWTVLLRRINPFQQNMKVPNILQILVRTTVMSSIRRRYDFRRDARYYLRPPVEAFGMLEFEAIDAIVETGYRYAKKKIGGLKGLSQGSQS